MNRIFVTTDTHGCLNQLKDCLNQAKFDFENDTLIHLGDVVDRGPDSKGVVDLLLTIKKLISIKGNHDHWWLEYLLFRHGAPHLTSHMTQGGSQTLTSYVNVETGKVEVPQAHIDFFKKQQLYHLDDQGRFFVHAGYHRDENIEYQDHTVFSWDRELMTDAMRLKEGQTLPDVNGFKQVFVGHCQTTYWKIDTPIYRGQVVDVDTGGCYGGKISLLDITDYDNHILYQNE